MRKIFILAGAFFIIFSFVFDSSAADKSRRKREKEAALELKAGKGTNLGGSTINVISNKDIQESVIKALEEANIVPMENLDILVKESKVTVTGTVDSLGEKEAIQKVIKSVPGVRGYISRIQILEE